MKDLLQKLNVPSNKIDIIPTGVDTDMFRPGVESNFRKQYGLTDKPIVMYLGSFIPLKGITHLIKASRLIKDAVPDVKFMFMPFNTDPKYLEECWNLIDTLDLKKDIFYLGSVPHRYIADLLAGCDVYVHTSFSEGLNRSILEAMSCGKPVVGSDATSTPECVRNGETGFLATPGVPEEYASNVIKLLNDSLLRENIGRKARKLIEKEFSLEVTAGKRLKMYQKLLN
jgi:glycosyltransferase involved in cell wall biosynthesis